MANLPEALNRVPSEDLPHILRLPTELIERVTDFLEPEGEYIFSLRLTCREIEQQTLTLFKRRYFTDVSYMLSYEDSFSVLLQVSNHPVFAKSIRRINFSIQEVARTWGQCRAIINQREDFPSDRSQRASLREANRQYNHLIEEGKDLEPGTLYNYVFLAFQNLQKTGNTPIIRLLGGADKTPPWGFNRLATLLGRSYLIQPYESWHWYDVICPVINKLNLPVTGLEVGGRIVGASLTQFHYLRVDLSKCLKSLRLKMSAHLGYWISGVKDTLKNPEWNHFLRFIEHCQGLEEFSLAIEMCSLRQRANAADGLFTFLCPGVWQLAKSLPQLRILELKNQKIPRQALQAFIEERSATIEVVRLELVYDLEGGSGSIMQDLWDAAGADEKRRFTLKLEKSYKTFHAERVK